MRRIVGRRSLALSALLLLVSGTALGQPAPPLFGDPATAVDAFRAAPQFRPDARRARVTTVNFETLEASLAAADPAGPPPFVLNLFEDVVLPVVFDRAERDVLGHTSWVGRVDGEPMSHVTFTWRGRVLTGTAQVGPANYLVRTTPDGRHIIEELAEPDRNIELPPRRPVSEPAAAGTAARDAVPRADPIDVTLLVLYTPAARSITGLNSLQTLIANGIANTNTALQNSGVNGRIVLAGTQELAYVEDPQGLGDDLTALTNSPAVAAARDAAGADLVSLVIDRNPGPIVSISCGLAWLGPSTPAFGFGVVERFCFFPNLSFSHELAHNFGADHAPEDCLADFGATGCQGIPYARGYKDPAQAFRTIMAYVCSTTNCPRVLNYSNPNVPETQTMRTTGTVTQHNARALNETFATIAAYRGGGAAGPPAPPTGLTASVSGSTVTLLWQASAGATEYILELGLTSGASNAFNQSVGGVTTVSGSASPGLYYWRVRARNGAGTSAASVESTFTLGGFSLPGVPGSLQVVVTGNSVSITWGAASGVVNFYQLEAGSAPSLADIATVQVNGTRFDVGGVPPNIYHVRVRGVGPGGPGPATPDAIVTVGGGACVPPSAPLNLTRTVNGNRVTLEWQPSASGTTPISYTILAGSSSNSGNIGSFPAGPGPSAQAIAPAGTYFVRLVATNACGTSAPSNEVIVVVQ